MVTENMYFHNYFLKRMDNSASNNRYDLFDKSQEGMEKNPALLNIALSLTSMKWVNFWCENKINNVSNIKNVKNDRVNNEIIKGKIKYETYIIKKMTFLHIR